MITIEKFIELLKQRENLYGDIAIQVEAHDDFGHRKYHCFTEPRMHVEMQGSEKVLIISD